MDAGTMKISSLHFRPYALPFVTPFQTARETLRVRKGWVIWVMDGEGGWGVGEAAPLPGFGMESHEECGRVLAAWARSLPGREFDPSHYLAPKAGTEASTEPGLEPAPWLAGGDSGGPPDEVGGTAAPAARHGLELALLDLAARRAGLPLHRLLHPEAGNDVEVNAVLGAASLEETVRCAEALAAQGYGTLKLKVGARGTQGAAGDFERLRAVRQALGEGTRLRIDANESWNETEALRLLEKLAPLNIEYVEQPLPADDLIGMARLAKRSPIPLAADEAVLSLEGARGVLERGAAHVLILKPMALGGPRATLAAARLAARFGARVVITTMLDGAVARAAATAVAAAVAAAMPGADAPAGGRGMAHGLATGGLLAEDLVAAAAPRGGRLALSSLPGLGLSLPPPPGENTGV